MESQEEVRGLTAAEKKQLEKLLEKANASLNPHSPSVRVGKEYVALVNLSLPRRNDPEKGVDLVMAGETVWLTDDEAAKYLRHGERDGRRVGVVRLKSEVDNNNPPKPHPQLLSGPIFRPAVPAPGTDGPRPDPAGSTRVMTMGPPVPESQQVPVQTGGEPVLPAQDAMDILPGGQLARDQVLQGADMDLVGAVKAQAGITGRTTGSTPNDGRR